MKITKGICNSEIPQRIHLTNDTSGTKLTIQGIQMYAWGMLPAVKRNAFDPRAPRVSKESCTLTLVTNEDLIKGRTRVG